MPAPAQEANYWVRIDTACEFKVEAATKHVSQFEPAFRKYRPDWDAPALARIKEEFKKQHPKKDGHYVEAFRRATEFVQQ